MSVAQLVDRFRNIALAQYEAIEDEKHSTYNKLFDRMLDVDNELRRRGHDARHSLKPLFRHPNSQVRLKAAIYSLAVEPKRARKVLEAISGSGEFPQAASANVRGHMNLQ